jgi:PAS domain S-box-containing protein
MTGAPERRGASRRREDHDRDRLFELTQDLLAVTGIGGRFRQVNPSFARAMAMTQAEFKDRPVVEFVHPDDASMAATAFERLKGSASSLSFECRFRDKDGRFHWLQMNTTPDAANDAIYITARDIMGRKLAEAESARFAAVVKSSNDAIISAGLSGTIESWNPSAERIFGYKASEALGKPLSMLTPRSTSQGRTSQTFDPGTLAEPIASEQAQRRRKDGMLVTVSLTVSPVRDASGAIVATSVIAREVARET